MGDWQPYKPQSGFQIWLSNVGTGILRLLDRARLLDPILWVLERVLRVNWKQDLNDLPPRTSLAVTIVLFVFAFGLFYFIYAGMDDVVFFDSPSYPQELKQYIGHNFDAVYPYVNNRYGPIEQRMDGMGGRRVYFKGGDFTIWVLPSGRFGEVEAGRQFE